MKLNGKPLMAGVALSMMAAATVFAQEEGSANPYEAIWVRNSFNLKAPPPPPPPPAPVVEKPASNVKLAGITSIISPKKALFVVQEANGKTEYPVLAEGEKLGDLEVVSIDEEAETVLVMSRGEEIKMSFDTHGLKVTAAPPSAAPGQPGAVPVAGVPGVPMAQPPGSPGVQPVPTVQPMYGVPPAQPGAIRQNSAQPGVIPGNSGNVPSTLPQRTIRISPNNQQGQVIDHNPKGAVPLTAEQADALYKVNAALKPSDYPPLPE